MQNLTGVALGTKWAVWGQRRHRIEGKPGISVLTGTRGLVLGEAQRNSRVTRKTVAGWPGPDPTSAEAPGPGAQTCLCLAGVRALCTGSPWRNPSAVCSLWAYRPFHIPWEVLASRWRPSVCVFSGAFRLGSCLHRVQRSWPVPVPSYLVSDRGTWGVCGASGSRAEPRGAGWLDV